MFIRQNNDREVNNKEKAKRTTKSTTCQTIQVAHRSYTSLTAACLGPNMGVDHGGTRGTSPPRIWSRGTLLQIASWLNITCSQLKQLICILC